MKEKWLLAREGSWEEVKPRITTALESGFDCAVVNREHVDRVHELGKIKTACFGLPRGPEEITIIAQDASSPDDLKRELISSREGGSSAAYLEIRSKKDEELAVEVGKAVDYLLVVGTDWKVIPLENMIAGLQGHNVKIISGVRTAQEAEVALSTLEHGADGVLLESTDLQEIKGLQEVAERAEASRLNLVRATITGIKPVGMGDRVCVDTCSLMRPGEGMLVGSQAKAFFLVQSEAEESPYVASRPFRVNAGAVHAYVRVGEKTRYLSELKSGDEVTVVTRDGGSRSAIVGRAKIERRPMMLVEAEVEGQAISTLLQNAETIKLVGAERSIPVTEAKVGDQVLVYLEETARHFGMSIKESIIEQ
jgi:3-dehydroquinate synthase II